MSGEESKTPSSPARPPPLLRRASSARLSSLPTFSGAGSDAGAEARVSEHLLRQMKIVLVLVGLPARGKSYITHKLTRYVNWMGFKTRVFNAGNTRRKLLGAGQDHKFFDTSDPDSAKKRDDVAMLTLDELLGWLTAEGHVGMFDATNTTRARRQTVLAHCRAHMESTGTPLQVVFIESICDDPVILSRNYDMKLANDDYKGKDPAAARADFIQRVEEYVKVYEPVSENDLSYIKILNVGQQVTINRCHGYLMAQISSCLCNMHIEKRYVWLTRHGRSEDNAAGRLGGDSSITDIGLEYARRLAMFVESSGVRPLVVWTSTLKRTKETAQPLLALPGVFHFETPLLNEIDAGLCEGMTYAEVSSTYPDEYTARVGDKLGYRYPGGGESYVDVIERVKPLILELERVRDHVLIIAHQAVLRTLLAYFRDTSLTEMVHLKVPLHTVIQLEPAAYDCTRTDFELGPDVTPALPFTPKPAPRALDGDGDP